MKPAEEDGPEVDGPYAWGDFLKADELSTEQVGDIDPVGVPPDAAVGRDLPCLEVGRILKGWDLLGEGSRAGLIEGCGRVLIERLVRPDVIEPICQSVLSETVAENAPKYCSSKHPLLMSSDC